MYSFVYESFVQFFFFEPLLSFAMLSTTIFRGAKEDENQKLCPVLPHRFYAKFGPYLQVNAST